MEERNDKEEKKLKIIMKEGDFFLVKRR